MSRARRPRRRVSQRKDVGGDAEPAPSSSCSRPSPCRRGLPWPVSSLSQIMGSGDTFCCAFPNLSLYFSSEPATLRHLCVAKSSVFLLGTGPVPRRLGSLRIFCFSRSLHARHPRLLSAFPEVRQCSEHRSPPKPSPFSSQPPPFLSRFPQTF